jgi:hypothetical protein
MEWKKTAIWHLEQLIKKESSARSFAFGIEEDPADIARWRTGKTKIKPRAVIKICKKYYRMSPSDFRPDIFPKGMIITFRQD